MTLYTSLSDEFESPVGQLTGYLDSAGNPLAAKKHYDLRSFYANDLTVPRTMPDFRYWNAASYDGTQMIVLDQPRSVTGRSIAARTMQSLDLMSGDLELPTTLLDLENYILASGNEGWPTGDPNVILAQDASNRYANVMTVVVPQGSTKTVASTYRDNIFTGLNDTGATYYIELVLPSFPAQAAAAHLDLANSFIDFTSDATGAYTAAQTDSIRFNQSLNSLTTGGNTYFRIDRNLLTHVDLASLQGIRFRLAPLGVGNVTVKFQAMRVFKSGDFDLGGYPSMGIETKRNVMGRSIPQLGAGQSEGINGLNMILWGTTRPKNVYQVVRFNTGHIPTNPSASTFSYFTRFDPAASSFLRFDFNVSSTQSQLSLSESINGTNTFTVRTAASTHTLSNSTDYYAVFEVDGLQARATLYTSKGAFFGNMLYTTDWISLTRIGRGYTGFSFNGYNYDFQIDWIKNRHAEFATFESLPFKSFTPVTGASLDPKASLPLDLSEQNYIPSGDATVTLDTTLGNPPPSHKIVRDGTDLFGGYQTTDFLFIGDPKFLTLDGDIYPQTSVHAFRVVLIDKYDTVAFNATIPNLKPNQWNHFSIPVIANITPANYKVLLQQVGFASSTFWIQNFTVNHDTVAWYLSPDAGSSWFPVLGDATGIYNGVNFGRTGADQTQLKIRAIALSDTAWIQGYEVIPHYANPGHFFPGVHAALRTLDWRITGSATIAERVQNVRISGQDFSNLTKDLRIFGATAAFNTTLLRTTGQLTSFTTRDLRTTGQTTSFRTEDFRTTGSLGSNIIRDVRVTGVSTTISTTADLRIAGEGSQLNGVYSGGQNVSGVNSFASWFGGTVPIATEFLDGSVWAGIEGPGWILDPWNGHYRLNLAVPMLPATEVPGGPSDTTTISTKLAAGAAGTFNSHFTTLATNLIAKGQANAFLRIGWEFNGNWYIHRADANLSAWKTYYQQIVSTMRAVAGANFRFVWNPTRGAAQLAGQPHGTEDAYPGDAYVDVIGMDIYDTQYSTPLSAADRWTTITTDAYSLNWMLSFAAAHGRPCAFPEWGLAKDQGGPRYGGGDSPTFIDNMWNVITTNNFAYHAFWDYDATDIQSKISVYSPAIGKIVQGPTQGAAFTADTKRGNKFSLYGTRTFSKATISLHKILSTGTTPMRVAVYLDTGGGIATATLKGVTNELVFNGATNSDGWYDLTFPSPITLNAGDYWLVLWTGSGGVASYYLDTGVTANRPRNVETYSSVSNPSDPFGTISSSNTDAISIYMPYTGSFAAAAFLTHA